MILFLLAAQAAAATALNPKTPDEALAACMSQARDDPAGAERTATTLGPVGAACRGMALTQESDFAGAADAFTTAAERVKDDRSARFWAQAGNAWLAAGQPAKARDAIDRALATGKLGEADRGEAHLDRARALVALKDLKGARTDLDQALAGTPDDPLAWLLSATLARRTGDLARAKTDIGEALKRSSDDASVQLEAGNIAAAQGDASAAKIAWTAAVRLAPDAPAGRSAATALTQFGEPAK